MEPQKRKRWCSFVCFFNLLTSKTIQWSTAVWEQNHRATLNYEQFVSMFCCMFDYAPDGNKISKCLADIQQGSQHAAEYTLEFWILSAGSGENEPTIKTIVHHGRNADILMEFTCCDNQVTLNALIEFAIYLDQLIQCQTKVLGPVCSPASPASLEPIQIGCTWLSTAKRRK